jgi:hypothetical protein
MSAMQTRQVFVHRREQAHYGVARATTRTQVSIALALDAGRRRVLLRHRRAPTDSSSSEQLVDDATKGARSGRMRGLTQKSFGEGCPNGEGSEKQAH